QALVEDTKGMEPDDDERLRAERERLRHVTELAGAAGTAAAALDPEDGDGAAALTAIAERAVAPVERLAPELARAGDELRDVELRLREVASELRAFLASLESDPGRLEHVESQLDRIAETVRRFRASSYEELLTRASAARAEPGTAVRAGRGDRIRGRAVADRARDRGGRRRRDDGFRRDRCGDRRRDRASCRRDPLSARRARAGGDDHASAPDRQRRRPPLPRGEDRGRSDAHADRAAQ